MFKSTVEDVQGFYPQHSSKLEAVRQNFHGLG